MQAEFGGAVECAQSWGAYTDTRQAPARRFMKYFKIYRDGFMAWPVGIISFRKYKGFGLGVWHKKNDNLHIAIGLIFSFSVQHINWKVYRKSAGA